MKGFEIPEGMTLPSPEELKKMMVLLRNELFPEVFGKASSLGTIADILRAQTGSSEVADAFVAAIPEIRRLLMTDVEAIATNDPAVSSLAEVVLSYPSIKVMIHYRAAHFLHGLGVPIIPRIITEIAHGETGVDIHPAARIGEYFAIDHGTGVVIGETCIIGQHVMLYQGVTLGAKNFHYDSAGLPVNIPRHPILEDNVTIYSNTSILGRVTIGHDSVIGGNVWLTHDVPAYSKVLQGKVVTEMLFEDGGGI
ncbi:MAG: serine acetyltransferase [Bacteroidales bacterium]|nr:serine acetyltransferase [Bacteroidales bacterium]